MIRWRNFITNVVLASTLLSACVYKEPLALSIEQAEMGCQDFGEAIPIKMRFQNLTDAPLTLHTEFRINPDSAQHPDVNIFPEIATGEGETISYGHGFVDFMPFSPTPDDFVEIPAHDSFETTLDFYIPGSMRGQYGPVPLPYGQYHFRLSYRNEVKGPLSDPGDPFSEQVDIGTWAGQVWSNQIEICIEDS